MTTDAYETAASNGNGSVGVAETAQRHDFSEIRSAIPIPNLIDVQRESYKRFLQMELLPGERDLIGLEAVFKSVFPISDFREMSSLDFVEYTIGDWECKCGKLKGLFHLRTRCEHCHQSIQSDPKGPPRLLCQQCGRMTSNNVTFCQQCGDPVGLKLQYEVEECQSRGLTYAAPLKVKIKLTVFEKEGTGSKKSVRDIKEQEVFFGELPLMTDQGTFIISGTERVVVSQLHRSPGVFFESSKPKKSFLGKIIPYRGSWIEFEYDQKDLLQVRIDRKRKFLGTVFLRSLGLNSDSEILKKFYEPDEILVDSNGSLARRVSESMIGASLTETIVAPNEVVAEAGTTVDQGLIRLLRRMRRRALAADCLLSQTSRDLGLETDDPPEQLPRNEEGAATAVEEPMPGRGSDSGVLLLSAGTKVDRAIDALEQSIGRTFDTDFVLKGRTVARKGRKVTPRLIQQLKEHGIEKVRCHLIDLSGAVFAEDLVDQESGEVLKGCEANAPVTAKGAAEELVASGISSFEVVFPEIDPCGTVLASTLRKDTVKTREDALLEVYRKLRPGDPPTAETARDLFHGMFFDDRKYDFSRVGRMKFNIKLHNDPDFTSLDDRTLTADDFFATVKYLLKLRRNIGQPDDIDHLGNRRVRAVGELLENQFRIGLIRMERAMKERMTIYQDMSSAMPHDLINAKPVMAAVREFFGSSQLSQFMDQINPLSEITHKRRLSALGPGGLSRERAGFDVRDVHTTHYGRICPIETPEGPNIGLISSLACFARINEHGFIESPYRRVENGQIVDEVNVSYAGDTSLQAGTVVAREVAEAENARLQAVVLDSGDTGLEVGQVVSLAEFDRANGEIAGQAVVEDAGDSDFQVGEVVAIDAVSKLEEDFAQLLIVEDPGDTGLAEGQMLSREEAEEVNPEDDACSFRDYQPPRVKMAEPADIDPPEKAVWSTHCDYLSAWEEDQYVIAQANIPINDKGFIDREFVNCRVAGDFQLKRRAEVQYLDVSPKQLVSVAASLIPFLENDDANRALMGSNMQRQAVPLLRADSPIVGTGMEKIAARDSGAVVLCKRDGIVDSVDSERIIVRVEDTGHEEELSREVGADIYQLIKFRRSNQNTCINQKPIVVAGQRVVRGQILADGPCTDSGELALGRNVLAAFMPWRGYNFEDAILVSERLVKDDYYTSLHVEEFEVDARDTKLGPEEITRDIPNISESYLRNLDESGIIRVGARVGPDDILVGKVVPKGDVQLTPEEKLLRAIFGDKAGEVKDASKRCPPGVSGIVVGAQVFSRKGVDKDARALQIEADQIERLRRNLDDEKRILFDQRADRLEELIGGKLVLDVLHDQETDKVLVKAGETLERSHFERLPARELKRLRLEDDVDDRDGAIDSIETMTIRQIQTLDDLTDEKIAKLRKGDELAPGVIKSVKVYVAMKRKLSAGDKMAGRHGNKGVIARVLPEEDMPFLPDGTPVEIVLNPLGVPSRMNVGQILETHLGWAGHQLGLKYAVPVFEGKGEEFIKQQLSRAGLPSSGKTVLYDGMTGEEFEQEVTVGIIYMLKLSHLVDDKIHARSIGPYSLITQQPLGGKAQFGGQRFGEMEVWALEAYGAAHILQELLTVKSDDVFGRSKIYESIVKGESAMKPGIPESFNVLIRELQSLCLDVELVQSQQDLIETALAAD